MKRYLRGAFPSIRDLDDVVQESFLRVWKARAATEIRSAKAYLYLTAKHVALDLKRRMKRSPVDLVGDLAQLDALDPRLTAVESLDARERIDLLARAIASLPGRCAEVFVLRKIEGYSVKETAEKLGLSPRTVENHSAAAVAKCEKFLREGGFSLF